MGQLFAAHPLGVPDGEALLGVGQRTALLAAAPAGRVRVANPVDPGAARTLPYSSWQFIHKAVGCAAMHLTPHSNAPNHLTKVMLGDQLISSNLRSFFDGGLIGSKWLQDANLRSDSRVMRTRLPMRLVSRSPLAM